MGKKNDFDALLDELSSLESTEDLTKAMSTDDSDMDYEDDNDDEDDKKIKAASKEGEKDGDYEDEMDEELMGKSMTVKIDGEDVEAFDGMELIKSFTSRINSSETKLAKALGVVISTVKSRDNIIVEQGKLIKSLQTKVDAIGNTGKGRKAVVNIHDKNESELKKSNSVEPNDFRLMLKSAVVGGAINAMEAGHAETALNNGADIPSAIIAKVAKHSRG